MNRIGSRRWPKFGFDRGAMGSSAGARFRIGQDRRDHGFQISGDAVAVILENRARRAVI